MRNTCNAPGRQGRRACTKALPPRAQRRVRHIEFLGDRPQPETTHHLQPQSLADDRPQHRVVARAPGLAAARAIADTPHTDRSESRLFDQQRPAQPAPVATPSDQPPQTRRTPLWRNHHLLPGRHIAHGYGHMMATGGAFTTLSSNPLGCLTGMVLSSNSVEDYCAAPFMVGPPELDVGPPIPAAD
jgi:hypothetical protein